MNTRFIDIAVLTLAALPAIALLAVGNLTEARDAKSGHTTVLSQNAAEASPAQKLTALTAHG